MKRRLQAVSSFYIAELNFSFNSYQDIKKLGTFFFSCFYLKMFTPSFLSATVVMAKCNHSLCLIPLQKFCLLFYCSENRLLRKAKKIVSQSFFDAFIVMRGRYFFHLLGWLFEKVSTFGNITVLRNQPATLARCLTTVVISFVATWFIISSL